MIPKKKFEKSSFYLLPQNSDFARFNVTLALKNLQAEIWHLNTQKYKNLFSLAKKNRFLYKRITPILMVKILDFNCVRNV